MDVNDNQEKCLARGAEIQNNLTKYLSDNLKIPVFSIDAKFVENVYSAVIEEVPELKNILTEYELRREVSEFVSKAVVFPPKPEEVEDRVKKFIEDLKQEKEYEAILLLKGLIDLPTGTKIGAMEIIEKDETKDKLMEHVNYLKEKGIINPQNCSWAFVKFTSHKTVDLSEVLYKILELPYSVLSLTMYINLDVRDTVGAIYAPNGNIWFLGTEFRPVGWSKYNAEVYGKYLTSFSSISQKEKQTALEQKIIQATQVFWLSRLSARTEIKFITLMSAFESLLLTQNDRDYLGLKLAEKTTFLLERESEKRIKLFKLMKKYYNKRSDLIHKGVNKITEGDDKTAENIFKNLVFKILDLTGEYMKMEQKSHDKDSQGLEDYIESLKFS